MPHRTVLICSLLALAFTPPVHADEVLLANGDRLTGKVVRKEGDELIFNTSYAGEVKIKWSQVVHLKSDQPMSLVLADQSLAQANTIGAPPKPAAETPAQAQPEQPQPEQPQPEQSQPEQKPEAAPPAVEQVTYINAGPGFDVLGIRWKGRINIGASGSRGNSETEDLHIDGEAIARRQHDRYTVNGLLDRGKDRDTVTKQNSRISGKYDRFIDRGWYGYAILTLEEDRFRDIDLRTTAGAGLGHQLIETERTNLSIEAGLNHVRTDFSLAPDESYPAARWALKYEQRLARTDLRFFHSHELLADLQDSERSFVRTQTGLRVPLLQGLLATAQLNADYDNAPSPGRTKFDLTYQFTVGYQW